METPIAKRTRAAPDAPQRHFAGRAAGGRLAALCAWALGGLEVEAAGARGARAERRPPRRRRLRRLAVPGESPRVRRRARVAFLIAGEARGFAEHATRRR